MQLPVLYEDDELLVVDKPPGIVVNRAESVHGATIQDWAESTVNSKQLTVNSEEERIFVERSGIAHRIDKETSGCLLIAKTPQVLERLLAQFRQHEIKKTYLAIVHGILVPDAGEINVPVGRLPWNSERFGILAGGKESVTQYKVVGTFERSSASRKHQRAHDSFSLVECYPQTGRTHQIRVHLKYINHPIVGDYLYAGRKTARDDRMWAPRVMLHAWKLSFTHPVSGQLVAIESPIPDDMIQIIQSNPH